MPIFRGEHLPRGLVEQIDAIPRTLLPEGAAREQLLREFIAGGPLIDVYTKPLMTEDYTGGGAGKRGYIIERPLRGRPDTRWSPLEWQQWVAAGMPTMACDFCDHTPAMIPVGDYALADGRPPTICYDCHSALMGIHGMTVHAVLNPCPQCGRLALQLDPTIPVCRDCLAAQHAAP
ncbi:MAG: hypothetical protein H0X24_00825 [Ktedonobacterales bacterium]|nr:hypothetical protein [Ktedonobacterales bacterium]